MPVSPVNDEEPAVIATWPQSVPVRIPASWPMLLGSFEQVALSMLGTWVIYLSSAKAQKQKETG